MLTTKNNRIEQVTQEDLVMFINACLACTGQKEFYDHAYGQKVSIDFYMTIFWVIIAYYMRVV